MFASVVSTVNNFWIALFIIRAVPLKVCSLNVLTRVNEFVEQRGIRRSFPASCTTQSKMFLAYIYR